MDTTFCPPGLGRRASGEAVSSIVFRAETIAMTDAVRAHGESRVQKSYTRIQNSGQGTLKSGTSKRAVPQGRIRNRHPRQGAVRVVTSTACPRQGSDCCGPGGSWARLDFNTPPSMIPNHG